MALVKRRVVNPAPSVLALVNTTKKRSKSMRRRRRNTRRRRTYASRRRVTANPRRRRHHVRRHRRYTASNRSYRRRNPVRHHRRRYHHRRRNPIDVSGAKITDFVVGGITLSIAQPIASKFLGGILSGVAPTLGQFSGPIITAATGWAVGKLFHMSSATKRFSGPVEILGYSTAIIQLIQPFISNLLGGTGLAPAAPPPAPMMSGWPQGYSGWTRGRMGAMRRRPHMRGIGVVTGIPPTITAPPIPPSAAAAAGNAATAPASMHGFAMRPGVWAH